MKLQGKALEYVASAYALGSLTSRARRRFEELLLHDIMVRRAWQRWEQRLSDLAPDVPPVRPEADTLPRILARIQKPVTRRSGFTSRHWVVLAALVLVAATIWLVMHRAEPRAPEPRTDIASP
jgi:anti-sigma-K factor RskA